MTAFENTLGRPDGFLCDVKIVHQYGILIRLAVYAKTAPTLGSINHSLEHQWNEHNEEYVVDKELRRTPKRRRGILSDGVGTTIFGGGRSRVSSDVGRSRSRSREASVEGVERVEAPQPEKGGRHFIAMAWRGVDGDCGQKSDVYSGAEALAKVSSITLVPVDPISDHQLSPRTMTKYLRETEITPLLITYSIMSQMTGRRALSSNSCGMNCSKSRRHQLAASSLLPRSI